jgi:hypothetical protein
MDNLTYFVNEVLIPSLHSGNMSVAFAPYGIHFEKKGDKWGAKNYLNGTPHRARWDKIFTTSKRPFTISEQGGDTIALITFYRNLSGLNYIEALKALSSACNLTFPEKEDNEKIKAFLAKQEEFENIATKMKKNLHTEGGKAVLEYLKGRYYSDEFIEFAEFGYCSPDIASEIRSILKKYSADKPTSFSYEVGKTNVLALPYRNGNGIQGFVFRRIDGEEQGKYSDVFISQKATKTYQLFGLTGLSLTGKKDKDRDLIVVEGEIDALRASFVGIPNVVAASGGHLNTEALMEAKGKGVLRVTILFDSEESAEKQEETDKKIETAIQNIYAVGLEPIVASFGVWNVEGNRVKMDSDKYLIHHTGEELSHLIKYNAEIGSLWMFNRLSAKYAKIQQDGGKNRISEADFSDFRRETINLLKKVSIRADRERTASEFTYLTGGVITEQTLTEEQEKKLQEQKRLQSISEAKKIAQEVTSLCEQGKMDEAIALGKKLTNLSEANKESEFALTAKPISLFDVKERYRNKPSGIRTGYYFGDEGKQEELIIQAAALTYICAPTSHGKTTYLQNLALRAAQDDETRGDVVFITFEESEEDIATEFLTLYCGEYLSANTLRSIRSLYEGDGVYFKPENLEKFNRKEAEFDKLLRSYRLRIYKRKNQLSDISGFIQYLNKNYKIKAVFVDYIQRIKNSEIRTDSKKVTMESVCDELMNVSLATGLPIVLGAQLNRSTASPLEMENQMIADASDIEHSANTIVLLWNSDTKPLASSSKYFTDSKRDKLTDEAQKLESKGFNIGIGGKLYALLTKNRGGQRNTSAIFKFDGAIRQITQEYPSIPVEGKTAQAVSIPQPPQETALPFDIPMDDNGNDF